MIFARSGCARSGDERGDKKFFWGLTVHTVHLLFFINNFIVIKGEHTLKGEQ